MDGHEQNLLALFESCDDYYQGSLSAAGLHELCKKLKLQHSYHRLTQYLLGDFKSDRIFFEDFKAGLLKLLEGAEANDRTNKELSLDTSAKYTYGETNYERRSRLKSSENDAFSSDNLSKREQDQILSCRTDESVPKKQKAKSKRIEKRFKNNLGKSNLDSRNQETSLLPNTMNEVEQLVTAWSNISQVTDSLSREELVRVFQCVGLGRDSEEAAQCVFEKLGFEEYSRITLQELLEFIKTWGSLNKEVKGQQMELEASQKNVSMEFVEHSSFGCITGSYLLEHWEREGVPGALQLLQNLGYSPTQQIEISSLILVLSEEIKNLNDEFKSSQQRLDPQVALLRASLILQNLYIHSLKTTIEHLNAEREKLRNDVIEANQRALLLAQEVDDHHSKLEHSTQQQVKILEQKHAEKIRTVTNQAKSEQDVLMSHNVALEKKLKQLEEDEIKNKAIISQLEAEARLSEQEHRIAVDQLTSLQQTKEKLEKDLQNAGLLQQKVSEMEEALNETDVMSLLERIQVLESENTNLRDRNDELSIEVEELSAKLLNTSTKIRTTSSNPVPVDQFADESIGGGAVKRRGDVFSLMESAEDSAGEEESPRMGKVRKCSHSKDFTETASSFKELQIHECNREDYAEDSCYSESGFDDLAVSDCKNENSYQIIAVSKELEQVKEISLEMPSFQEDWCDDIKDQLKQFYDKVKNRDAVLASEVLLILKEIITEKNVQKVSEAEESLKSRCKELEASLELLKEEYEKTEDYWSEKLEEERGFFEEEQKVNDKKYSELLEKILEYEEILNAEKEHRQRLETIEEKDSFEKQVADMEQECAELKCKLNEVMKEKEMETEKLKNQIERLKLSREVVDHGVQVTDFKSTEADSWDLNKESYVCNGKSERLQPELKGKSPTCKQCEELKNLLQTKLQFQAELDILQTERERLFKHITDRKQKLTNYGENGRISELEQKCHTLMITLRQQQKQTEDILKNTWKQHKAEVKDLKSVIKMTEEKLKLQTKVIQEQLAKLAKTDLLVKDLFVENAYLISSVQKLEKQYQSSVINNKSSL